MFSVIGKIDTAKNIPVRDLFELGPNPNPY